MSVLDGEARADRQNKPRDRMKEHRNRPDELATVRRRFGDRPDSDELAEPPLVLEPDREAGVAVQLRGSSEEERNAVEPVALFFAFAAALFLKGREADIEQRELVERHGRAFVLDTGGRAKFALTLPLGDCEVEVQSHLQVHRGLREDRDCGAFLRSCFRDRPRRRLNVGLGRHVSRAHKAEPCDRQPPRSPDRGQTMDHDASLLTRHPLTSRGTQVEHIPEPGV